MKKRTPTSADNTSSAPRRRRGRIIRYIVLGVGCIIIVDALVGDRGLLALVKAQQQYRAVESALERSRADNARLRALARDLRDNPGTIEALARRDLGLIRPGEKLVIVKDAPSPATPPAGH